MRKAWLSIDFEDIAHDFKREFGLPHDGSMRVAALERAYDAIDGFCRTDLGGARLTFFTTGILAEKCPAIVARIARDGHEIACHYHWHDMARDDPPDVFEANLRRAIDVLETASGAKVLGFRAPRFSLGIGEAAHFRVLERLFAYDSSVTVADAAGLHAFRAAVGVERLVLLPVVRRKVWPGLPAMRAGGAYLKYFPAAATRRNLDLAAGDGLAPMLYLHPYEFVADGSFRFPLSEMTGLALRRKAFLWARQVHCHVLGNAGVPDRLRAIFRHFAPGGPMRELLPGACAEG
jgi:hypothetical protein